ncbi:MAG: hypothetical protein GY851_21770 [bacterium]|nr:hypothetical protein [bacterium]
MSKAKPKRTSIRPFRRIAVIGDTHCGALTGLTPPTWQVRENRKSHTKRNKWAVLQTEIWDNFTRILDSIAPIDIMFHMGDCIDGKGTKSGGTEQITGDMEEQSDMAVAVCDEVRRHGRDDAFKAIGVYGTGYHVGASEDWENIVAERAGWDKIGAHEWPNVDGFVFDLKHKIGSSSIPHGRHTAIAKDRLWGELWAAEDLTDRAQCYIRGHVHYHQYCGGPDWLALTNPPLQAMGSKFGSRECSGIVHWGLTHFDISPAGELVDWRAHIVNIKAQRTRSLAL